MLNKGIYDIKGHSSKGNTGKVNFMSFPAGE